ncbi:hypothetical protein C1X73_20015 [Pseudomonas sp. FW305-130]|nr:hypothetical protein C1X73_20015 [Pseudomonas sp. FW305-130]
MRRDLLQAGRDQVERLIAAADQAVFHQDADHLDAFTDIQLHHFGQIQRLPRGAVQLLVSQAAQCAQGALGC